jgi:hypothetical protein
MMILKVLGSTGALHVSIQSASKPNLNSTIRV